MRRVGRFWREGQRVGSLVPRQEGRIVVAARVGDDVIRRDVANQEPFHDEHLQR